MLYRNKVKFKYYKCIELSEKETDIRFLIERIETNYKLLQDIALKHNGEDISLITLLDAVFKDNIKKLNDCLDLKEQK